MNSLATLDARYDAVVVGARCAGASTAMLLAQAGLRVLAIDRAQAGSDTLSTHALMRGGVLQLHRWGLLPRLIATGVPAIRTTAFHYGDESVEVAIKARDGVDALFAPRRTVLDALLVDAAREAGARVMHGIRARGLAREVSGRVKGIVLENEDGSAATIETGLVIGADGIRSQVADWVGAPVESRGRHATGILYGYWAGLACDGYQWHYRPGSSVGAIPTHDGLTCVFVAVPPDRLRAELRGGREPAYLRLLAVAAPGFARRTAGAALVGPLRSFPGTRGYLRRAHGAGWALVGDAGFFRDPITAHGMTDALRDAELLARAVLRDTPDAFEEYQRSRDAFASGMLEITDEISSFEWDLARARSLHLELSRNMTREAEFIRSFEVEALSAAGDRVLRQDS